MPRRRCTPGSNPKWNHRKARPQSRPRRSRPIRPTRRVNSRRTHHRRRTHPLPRLLDLMRRQMEVTLQMTGHMAAGPAAEWLRDLAAFQEEWRRHAEGTIAG